MSATPADHVVALLWEGRADEAAVMLCNCESPVAEALVVGFTMAGRKEKLESLLCIMRSQGEQRPRDRDPVEVFDRRADLPLSWRRHIQLGESGPSK